MRETQMILEVLRYQRDHGVDGSAYKALQCDFAYNSNKIEGSTLTHDQTVTIWDRGYFDGQARVDDIIEITNHFTLFDHILDTVDAPLTSEYLCSLQGKLKRGTSAEHDPLAAVGDFKSVANVIVGGGLETETASPSVVPDAIAELVERYEDADGRDFDSLLDFHVRFEQIHPFSDGNGRVGRLVLFKECLRNGEIPFVITDDMRAFYIRGLRNWEHERGWLRDTCLLAQDYFRLGTMPLIAEYHEQMVARGLTRPCDDPAPEDESSPEYAAWLSRHGLSTPSGGGSGPKQ